MRNMPNFWEPYINNKYTLFLIIVVSFTVVAFSSECPSEYNKNDGAIYLFECVKKTFQL